MNVVVDAPRVAPDTAISLARASVATLIVMQSRVNDIRMARQLKQKAKRLKK